METQNKPLYNPNEAAQIVRHLTRGIFDPEYILLFGKLAGGTPHSDPLAYDILMITRQTPIYDWKEVERYLRYQMPMQNSTSTHSPSWGCSTSKRLMLEKTLKLTP